MALFTAKMRDALGHFAQHRKKAAAYRYAYNAENMKPNTVHHEAYLLFEHPLMKQAVQTMEAVAAVATQVDSAWVLKRAALIADFNINAFVTTDDLGNSVYDFRDATADDWYCISEYTVDEITKGRGDDMYDVERVKLKSHCKLRALELVGKHTDVQAFREQLEITGALGIAQISTEDYKAARADMLEEDDC